MVASTPAPSGKAELRDVMRRCRRSLDDRPVRSQRIWSQVEARADVVAARRVLVFTSIVGEPETASFVSWCRQNGKDVAVPEDAVDATWPDVIVVPGLAFTAAGARLGQGGGWYDRLLADVRSDCVTVGVCFAEQIVDVLPIEPHDIPVRFVVTDALPAASDLDES